MLGDDLGILLLFIPEEYGGLGGGAASTCTVSAKTMARIDLGVATGVLATFLGSDPIRVGGHRGAARTLDVAGWRRKA